MNTYIHTLSTTDGELAEKLRPINHKGTFYHLDIIFCILKLKYYTLHLLRQCYLIAHPI